MHELYHFCAAHMVESIMKNGLTLGELPIVYPIGEKFLPKHQWLTTDGDPANQSWATRHVIDYSRTTFRLTIELPPHKKKRLYKAVEYIKQYPIESRVIITGWKGHEHWYIFKGIILPEWITRCEQMPQEA